MKKLTKDKAKELLKTYIEEKFLVPVKIELVKKEDVENYVKNLNTTYYILTLDNSIFEEAEGEIVEAINFLKEKYEIVLIN